MTLKTVALFVLLAVLASGCRTLTRTEIVLHPEVDRVDVSVAALFDAPAVVLLFGDELAGHVGDELTARLTALARTRDARGVARVLRDSGFTPELLDTVAADALTRQLTGPDRDPELDALADALHREAVRGRARFAPVRDGELRGQQLTLTDLPATGTSAELDRRGLGSLPGLVGLDLREVTVTDRGDSEATVTVDVRRTGQTQPAVSWLGPFDRVVHDSAAVQLTVVTPGRVRTHNGIATGARTVTWTDAEIDRVPQVTFRTSSRYGWLLVVALLATGGLTAGPVRARVRRRLGGAPAGGEPAGA